MSKRFRVSSASLIAAVNALLIGTGAAFAAAPEQTQPGSGVFDNFLIVVIGGVLLALFAALAGGSVIAVLAVGLSRFFRRNLPTDEEMAEVRASLADTGGTSGLGRLRRRIKMTPNAEPIVMATVGFVAFFILSSVVLAATPKPVQGTAEGEAPPTAGLPREGDFTQIVAELPPGDAARGSRLYVSSGCSGCHSLEKDKRLVGPTFYDVFDVAATRVPDMGAKEYLYQSIVDPNAFIVPTYQANIMPQTFSTQLSAQQMSDMLVWIERDHSNQQ